MFGLGFGEIAMVALVALLVLGPRRLPGALRTLGEQLARLRRVTREVRLNSGIDELLREEGLEGGVAEFRSLLRGGAFRALAGAATLAPPPRGSDDEPVGEGAPPWDPYATAFEADATREYPPEGVDTAGALPDDLLDPPDEATEREALRALGATLAPAQDLDSAREPHA